MDGLWTSVTKLHLGSDQAYNHATPGLVVVDMSVEVSQ